MLATDSKLPVTGGAEKRTYVRSMFDDIAPTYDRLNRIISLSFDLRWRRHAVAQLGWERVPEGIYLDLCAGTMDFAAIRGEIAALRDRVDATPRAATLFTTAIVTAVLTVVLTILVLRFGVPGLMPRLLP